MTTESRSESPTTELPEQPDVHAATLGYNSAVNIARYEPRTVIGFGFGRILRKSVLDTTPPLVNCPEDVKATAHNDLSTARDKINGLNPRQRTQLAAYCDSVASETLHKIDPNNRDDHKVNWVDWLGYHADDRQLLKFLKWHVGKIEEQQTNPAVVKEIRRQRDDYKVAIKSAIEAGWLHKDAQRAIDGVDGIKVYIGDIFDTLMQERGGYHVRGTDHVVISGSSDSERLNKLTVISELKRVTWHEFNHAVLGSLQYRWLDEAATEHIAQSLAGGSPEILNPIERAELEHRRGTYVTERDFVSDLMLRGREPIPVSLLTRTYSSKSSSYEFARAVDLAWPQYAKSSVTVLGQINNYIMGLETMYEREGCTQMQAQEKAIIKAQAVFLARPEDIFTDKHRFLPGPMRPITGS